MNALADKAHKQGMPHSDMHSITHAATSFNNHPYISSSGTPVGTKFTATHIGINGGVKCINVRCGMYSPVCVFVSQLSPSSMQAYCFAIDLF